MGKDRTIDIYVKPDSSKPCGYDYWLEEGKQKIDRVVFDKNADKIKKTDVYDVHFKLHNEGGAKLRFSAIPEKALWVKTIENEGDACPDCKSYWDGFYLNTNKNFDSNDIWVVNPDMNRQLFAFAFNCVPKGTVEGPETNYVWIDPIGENRNGGESVL